VSPNGGRTAWIAGPGHLELRTVEEAPPDGTAIAMSIVLCGICGTDLASFRTGSGHSPAVCGHEWVATVTELGPDVTTVEVGMRVVVAVPPPCSRCPECAAGLPDFCRHVVAVSRGRDAAAPAHGGFAQRLVVDESRVVPARAELTDIEAAQVEPASVAFHGVRRAGIALGEAVVVLGGGPIGLLAAQCARAAGGGIVVVVEPIPARRTLALRLGVDVAVAPGAGAAEAVADLTNGRGGDVVLECTGRGDQLATAVDLTRRGGTVVLLGYTQETVETRPGTWLSREITIRGAVAFTRADVLRTMLLMAQGRVRTADLHTRTVGLDELSEVFSELLSGGSTDAKVLVDPSA
jgi:(R,R)-butanediol dehydrogenase / meso-butanediol dehydrogenase / diacetyl reductase